MTYKSTFLKAHSKKQKRRRINLTFAVCMMHEGWCRALLFLSASFLVSLSEQAPVIPLSRSYFKDSKQIDSHVNTAKVGPQFSVPALNCWLPVYRLFVSRRVRMDRSNRKTNSHSQGHVKGERRPVAPLYGTAASFHWLLFSRAAPLPWRRTWPMSILSVWECPLGTLSG